MGINVLKFSNSVWQPAAAVAACVCVCVSMYLLYVVCYTISTTVAMMIHVLLCVFFFFRLFDAYKREAVSYSRPIVRVSEWVSVFYVWCAGVRAYFVCTVNYTVVSLPLCTVVCQVVHSHDDMLPCMQYHMCMSVQNGLKVGRSVCNGEKGL